MGNRDQGTLKSDSGYGDDASETPYSTSDGHPLALKGYDIGSASRLQVGDVFEFLWADAPQFEWEWKCLGYTRFIVLRHSEEFPHHCACIPVSTGPPSKHEFAKPGIDSFQQGYVFANGDPNPGYEQSNGGHRLPYSPVGIELKPGKLRVKEDSRANYADIVDIDHDAQVMVVGDVVKYFDRVRRNVNKAFMRQILRKALEKYQADKAEKAEKAEKEGGIQVQPQEEGSESIHPPPPESVDGDGGGADCKQTPPTPIDTFPEVIAEEEEEEAVADPDADTRAEVGGSSLGETAGEYMTEPERKEKRREEKTETEKVEKEKTDRVKTEKEKREDRPRRYSRAHDRAKRSDGSSLKPKRDLDYDLMSMHNVAMAGLNRP
ncbi:hypothetical protein F5Y15DRAFT_67383 [Xylariaceae sp. FL0016]|nr:hypothetical protein F5Y15DRAFT_67383 [Xylariaceae sp. FL0016]